MEIKYRVRKSVYRSYLTSEDGPGSLTNVGCHKPVENIIWQKTRKEEIGVDYFSMKFYDNDNGFVDVSYALERFNEETQKWCLVGHLQTFAGTEEEYYESLRNEEEYDRMLEEADIELTLEERWAQLEENQKIFDDEED